LTILGIIIGVGAVITLMSVGEGVETLVAESFQGLGSNLLFVIPGNLEEPDEPGVLTLEDAEAIADPFLISDVVAIAPELQRTRKVVYRKEDTSSAITGVTPEYEEVRSFRPVEGSFITGDDVLRRSRVAVLGQSVVEALFPPEVYPIGQVIKIAGVPFRVVGLMEEKGGSGFQDQDNVVFVPLSTAESRLFRSRDARGRVRISILYVQVTSEERMDAVNEQITELLRERHKIAFRDDDDFTVFSQAELLDITGEITGVLTIFLGSIAAISLLVGGIGIMNIMLVSVTERTREIGIRKAVGARKRDILFQFLLEAIVLSMLGGLVGIALGVVGSRIVSNLAEELETVISAQTILLATGFAAAVGLFFGIYPATRAARLNPIDALRYE
jgi:putative ABC transport system permease protein